MSKTPKADQPPTDLAERGRELWTSVVPAFTLEPHERVVLATACRQADLVAALEDVLARDGLIVAGSAGQPRLTPVAAELRQARVGGAGRRSPTCAAGPRHRRHRCCLLRHRSAKRRPRMPHGRSRKSPEGRRSPAALRITSGRRWHGVAPPSAPSAAAADPLVQMPADLLTFDAAGST